MLTLSDLKARRDLVAKIDWDMTPQQAYEAYQIKSIGAWKNRSLPDVYYFLVAVWNQEAKVQLVKRTLKDSEEIAEVEPPARLLADCVSAQAGDPPAYGQYPLDEGLKNWLRAELEAP